MKTDKSGSTLWASLSHAITVENSVFSDFTEICINAESYSYLVVKDTVFRNGISSENGSGILGSLGEYTEIKGSTF